MPRWFYIYTDTRNVPEKKKYFYTEVFQESTNLYKSLIKPTAITFTKSKYGRLGSRLIVNSPSYPMPPMTKVYYVTTYVLCWMESFERINEMINGEEVEAIIFVIIQYFPIILQKER